jgi:hypothetical protein
MKNKPELLVSSRQAREQYLQSYSLREIYRMCERGELRAVYEQRGDRRKWSIPVSAILEFQQSLIPNSDQQDRDERGVTACHRLCYGISHPNRAPRAISIKGGRP